MWVPGCSKQVFQMLFFFSPAQNLGFWVSLHAPTSCMREISHAQTLRGGENTTCNLAKHTHIFPESQKEMIALMQMTRSVLFRNMFCLCGNTTLLLCVTNSSYTGTLWSNWPLSDYRYVGGRLKKIRLYAEYGSYFLLLSYLSTITNPFVD